MFGLYLTKKIPFKNIYFHGMVLDAKGQKMRKSKGNVLSPIEMSDKFGTDALRMALVVGNPAGSNISLSENKIKGYKHFANKVWNVARFVLTNTKDLDTTNSPKLLEKDNKHIKEINLISKQITGHLESFRIDLAADKIYHYFWHTFADIILEESKQYLSNGTKLEKESTQWMLYIVFTTCLKLLHPFMPFLTEAIWESVPMGSLKKLEVLMVEEWTT